MGRQRTARDGSRQVAGDDAHRRLLAGVPVTERRMVVEWTEAFLEALRAVLGTR